MCILLHWETRAEELVRQGCILPALHPPDVHMPEAFHEEQWDRQGGEKPVVRTLDKTPELANSSTTKQ